jgi:hypothetical protein
MGGFSGLVSVIGFLSLLRALRVSTNQSQRRFRPLASQADDE